MFLRLYIYLFSILPYFAMATVIPQSGVTYPIHNLQKGEISLTPESFNRYVRPQLRNMVVEYYQLLRKLEPSTNEFIELKNKAFELSTDWQKAVDICQKDNNHANCEKEIKGLYKKSRELDRHMLALRKSRIPIENFIEEKQVDAAIETTKLVDEISNINYANLHYLEEVLITLNAPNNTSSIRLARKEDLQLILIKSEMTITSVLSKQYQEIFEYLYQVFIKTAENNVVRDSDREFLLKNLERYNMVWNAFHMKLSKGGEEVPKPILQTISIMHNRWNSILKILID
jgi:hypothetical protein